MAAEPWLRRRIARIDRRAVFALCLLIVLANLVGNRLVLGAVVSEAVLDGLGLGWLHLGSAVAVAALLALRRKLVFDLRVVHLLVGVPVSLLVFEALLRATFLVPLPIPVLSYPGLYADPYSEDRFWLLEARRSGEIGGGAPPHPELGWVAGRGDPWLAEASGAPVASASPVLVFGDSFVDGRVPPPLAELLPGRAVLDYGVAGYGTDQIVLRVERALNDPWPRSPQVVVGVLPQDMDRSLLSFRGRSRPHFRVGSDGELAGPFPASADDAALVEERGLGGPLTWALAASAPRLVVGRHRGDPPRRQALNRLLFQRLAAFARERKLDLRLLAFCERRELVALLAGRTPPRHRELREHAKASGLELLEARVWLAAALEGGATLDELYLPDGHHTDRGSRVIAQGLADALR
jgi:hypothetical protein